jgi:RNA polymerase sigma factor (sigma-70 family)
MTFDPRDRANVTLVVRAALGDAASLDRLLRAIQQPLYDHVAFITRDRDVASDVLQDVLVIVCRSLIRLHDPTLFRAWAFRIATREAIRAVRRTSRRDITLDDAAEIAQEPVGEPVFDAELVAALPALVGELPPACGVVVRLRYLEELSVAEVAEALNVPAGTVKSRAAYGVVLLRRRLSIEEPDRDTASAAKR